MKKNIRYKAYKDNKIIALYTNIKNKLLKSNRAFNMLKKGSNINEPVINSKIHRSIK